MSGLEKKLRFKPEGPTHPPLCRPSGPQIPDVRIPAHATGIGFVGPPGLKMRNFKKRQRGIVVEKRRKIYPSLTFRVMKTH